MDAGICCMSAGTGGRVELRVLGAVELRTAGGRLVPLPGPRLRAVLGVLALHANRVVATERLLENVWGQAPPKTARNSLQGHVSRLRRLLAASGEADLGCGRHADLVDELDGLTRAHPLRERLRRQQMLALYRSGRPAEALAVYGDARTVLRERLGIDPSPELDRLHRAMLARDPSLDLPRAPAERAADAGGEAARTAPVTTRERQNDASSPVP